MAGADGGGSASSKKRKVDDDVENDPDAGTKPKKQKQQKQQGDSALTSTAAKAAPGTAPEQQASDSKHRDLPEQRLPSEEANLQVKKMASDILQAADPGLKNINRIAKHLQKTKLRRCVYPVIPVANEQHMLAVMRAAPIPGRKLKITRRIFDEKLNRWEFTFKDIGTAACFTAASASARVTPDILPKTTPTGTITRIVEKMEEYFLSWPYVLAKNTPMPRVFCNLALAQLVLADPQIHEVLLRNDKYEIRIDYIDRDTGNLQSFWTQLYPSDAQMRAAHVPPLQDFAIYNAKTGESKLITAANPQYVKRPNIASSIASSATLHVAQDALRYISLQLIGTVATEERMIQILELQKEQLGITKFKSHHTGIYGGEAALYRMSLDRVAAVMRIFPSMKVLADFGGNTLGELTIDVHSKLATRVTPVLDTIIQLFCDGQDLRLVWLEAARMADQVNHDIHENVAPLSQCECSDEQSRSELHACRGCGMPVICNLRTVDNSGRLVCNRCYTKNVNLQSRKRPRGEPLNQYKIKNSLEQNFKDECRNCGFNPSAEPFKSILQQAISNVTQNLPVNEPTKYVDGYTGLTHDIRGEVRLTGKNPSRRRYTPSIVSIDAVIPRFGHPKNFCLGYSAGNLITTSTAVQMAKNRALPWAVAETADFLTKANPAADDRKRLVERSRDLTLVGLKRFHIMKATIGTEQQRFDKAMAEIRCGKPSKNESGPWEETARRYTQRAIPALSITSDANLWDTATYKRTQACAFSIAKFFGVVDKISKLTDGTLWIGEAFTHPDKINRNAVALFCKERLAQMRLSCNKKWQTTDTEESLYKEIIFQYCASITELPHLQHLREKYYDRFKLPLLLTWHSLLRLSVAHRGHGFGMATGWPVSESTDVLDRFNNDNANNMLIESWFTNCGKADMEESYYREMDQILQSIKVSSDWYDPSLPAAKGDPRMYEDLAEEDEKDDFDGYGFDADVVGEEQLTGEAEPAENEQESAGDAPLAGEEGEGDTTGASGNEFTEEPGARPPPQSKSLRQHWADLRALIVSDAYRNEFITNDALVRTVGTAQAAVDDGKEDDFDIDEENIRTWLGL